MNSILILLNITLLVWLTRFMLRAQPPENKLLFGSSLAFKMLAGVALGVLYFYHYRAGDTISYWKDGTDIAALMRTAPAQALAFFWDENSTPEFTAALLQSTPRSLYFAKICGLIAFLSGDNYWVMATWMSFISFLGSWLLFRSITTIEPGTRPAAAVAFLFFPSAIFWSSGLIKESIGLAALYVLIAIGISIVQGKRPSGVSWILVVVALWVGWNLKYYWLGIFLPVALAVVAVKALLRWRGSWGRVDLLLWLIFFMALLAIGTNIHPNFYASRFLEVIYHNNLEFTRLSEPPRIVQYLNLEPTTTSLFLNAPAGLIAGLFRPFIWESFNALSLLASLENTLLLILVILALPAARQLKISPHRLLLVAAIVYVVFLITFLALSTPNFGTLSRYRIGAIPMLVFLCLGPHSPIGRWLSKRDWFG